MQADVSLREHVAHCERQHMRRVLDIGQTDDAAAVKLLMLSLVPWIGDDAIYDLAIAVVGFQRRWRVTVGVVRLRVNFLKHPIAEVGELRTVVRHPRYADVKPRFEIQVEAARVSHDRLRRGREAPSLQVMHVDGKNGRCTRRLELLTSTVSIPGPMRSLTIPREIQHTQSQCSCGFGRSALPLTYPRATPTDTGIVGQQW